MKHLRFIFKAATVGLVAALILYIFLPSSWLAPPRSTTNGFAGGLAGNSGPVSYTQAVTVAAPAVVNIYTSQITENAVDNPRQTSPLFEQLFGQQSSAADIRTSLGSGVIVSSDGYLLTNNHLIAEADEIQVMVNDGSDHIAQVIGRDPETDLAVLRIPGRGLPTITMSKPNTLRVGDVVLAIGNSLGVGQAVTMGIVSATGRDRLGLNTFEDFIQTDAAINPGNSGGALINANGELVGINTAIFSEHGGSQGIGFAIPMSLAKDVAEQIIKHGRVIRGWLGVEARDLSPQIRQKLGLPIAGVLVTAIYEQGPADKAGLRPGDLLVEVNGQMVSTARDLLLATTSVPPETWVEIRALRDDKTFHTQAMLIQRPIPLQAGR